MGGPVMLAIGGRLEILQGHTPMEVLRMARWNRLDRDDFYPLINGE
ncbi:MAG TPA: hypothetical protein VL992_04470 [Tepidisphaeraceae bacterium]|nr:hypothetical protein [Tepidisphaeraceae bacterium]